MKLPYSHNFFPENVTSDLKGANATSFPLLENEKGKRGEEGGSTYVSVVYFFGMYFTNKLVTYILAFLSFTNSGTCREMKERVHIGRFQKIEIRRRGSLF